MNVEQELISYVLLSGDRTCLTDGGIRTEYFLDDQNKLAFEWIRAYADRYHEAPTPSVFLDHHPEFSITPEDKFSGPLEFLTDKLFADYRMVLLHIGVSAIDDALGNDDFDKALAALLETSRTILSTDTSDGVIDGVATVSERVAKYLNPPADDELVGLSTGFSFLDAATGGLQPGQFVVLIGLAKSCKTTITLEIMRSVWAAEKKPLLLSFEMPAPQILARWDGFACGINPSRLVKGDLSRAERKRLELYRDSQEGKQPYILVEDKRSVMTLSGIRAKIETHKPDVLFLDGAYFLTDEISRESQTPIALTNISRGLKQLAMICEIPVVATTQALPGKLGKGNKLNAYSGGYTSAWAQDCDVIAGTLAEEGLESVYHVPILAARNAAPSDNYIQVTWDPPAIKEVHDADDGLPAI